MAKDLIRLAVSDANLRMNPDANVTDIQNSEIEELIFDSNVRGYLKQR